jgi:adenylate cyclase
LNPDFSVCHLFLAAALVRLGHQEEAIREAQRVLALDPALTIRGVAGRLGFAPAVAASLMDAWRRVGLPEG